jgi:hypothetical protein
MLKRIRANLAAPLSWIGLSMGAIVLLFQNCGTYETIYHPLYDRELLSTCIGPTCVRDLNYLSIYVGNSDPILITRNTERAIDLGGYCDTGGYPDSKIYIELRSGATSVIPPFLTTSKCDSNGRFRVLVELPASYNYNLAYSVVMTFRAVDGEGNEYDHPTGVNRREISLLTAP